MSALRPQSARAQSAAGDLPLHRCSWPGCEADGPYRAPRSPRKLPRSPQDLAAHTWFCLEHIRQYNASWNYYAGMDETQVEADLRRDQVWERPSWRMGVGKDGRARRIHDPLGVLDDKLADAETARPAERKPLTAYEKALAELELSLPVTEVTVKMRYKALVKKHHPDRNNGDKNAEERFKKINEAYRTIMDSFAA